MIITSKPCYQLTSIKWQRLPKVNEMANNEFQLQRKAIDKSLKKSLTVKCPFSSSSNISWKEISVWRLTSALKAPLKANPIHSDVLVHFRSSSTTSTSPSSSSSPINSDAAHQHLLRPHHQRITKIVTIQYTLMDWSNGDPSKGWKPLTQENFSPIKKGLPLSTFFSLKVLL